MNKTELKKIKEARDKLGDVVLGYCDGNVAVELDEAYTIIDEIIKKDKQIKKAKKYQSQDQDWIRMNDSIKQTTDITKLKNVWEEKSTKKEKQNDNQSST